jgi:hypothetical protein
MMKKMNKIGRFSRFPGYSAALLWFSVPGAYILFRKFFELPSCVFKGAFGIPCPGCGLGHSLDAIFSGALVEGVIDYPAIVPLCLMYVCIGLGLAYGKKSVFLKRRVLLSLFFLALIAVLSHWLYKLVVL